MVARDDFETLGLPRAYLLDISVLEQRFRDLSRSVHPDRHASAPAADRRLAAEHAMALNESYRRLRSPMTRALSLLAIAGRPLAETDRAEPALLMEIMSLREEVESARAEKRDTAPTLSAVDTLIQAKEAVLARVFDGTQWPVDPSALQDAYRAGVSLKYLFRLQEELETSDENL
ncbi:MAG: Fe-S protein assembly co-chaperone HscB [Deltaproteobacteria bacterium]|nr:Fe-S protein assembly co-chaperone HscB [Deltaproteobacteria bacterium]